MDPKLYIIATPLGNADDITRRALKIFEKVSVFFAEDTRELKKLLGIYGVPFPDKEIRSMSTHNLEEATELALKRLSEGRSVGLVCDRGTPGISDPGTLLVRRAHERGFQVEPIPGASSVTTAASVSGISSNRFTFLGFLPTETRERAELLEGVLRTGLPFLFFESPRRIREGVELLRGICPNARVFVGREMTKQFQSYTLKDLKDWAPEDLPELGEYVVFVEPRLERGMTDWMADVHLRVASEKEWSKVIAKSHGVSASDVYNALHELRRKSTDQT